MKINGIEINSELFAYDTCHKIYIIEDEDDKEQAIEYGYEILNTRVLEETYNNSCDLKFISNWKLNIQYVKQFENAIFEY